LTNDRHKNAITKWKLTNNAKDNTEN
jgi:hypothetical protein